MLITEWENYNVQILGNTFCVMQFAAYQSHKTKYQNKTTNKAKLTPIKTKVNILSGVTF